MSTDTGCGGQGLMFTRPGEGRVFERDEEERVRFSARMPLRLMGTNQFSQ
jgi:hypothetical protein